MVLQKEKHMQRQDSPKNTQTNKTLASVIKGLRNVNKNDVQHALN